MDGQTQTFVKIVTNSLMDYTILRLVLYIDIDYISQL